MKKKIALAAALLCGTAAQVALADSLSGNYKVQSCSLGSPLQVGTVEKIEALSNKFVQSLDMQGQDGPANPYTPLLTAIIGDVINRPTPETVQLGYTTVDRQIAGYDAHMEQIVFQDFQYDMSLTDAQGLAAGPVETITIKAQSEGLSYNIHYNDGEEYNCVLVAADSSVSNALADMSRQNRDAMITQANFVVNPQPNDSPNCFHYGPNPYDDCGAPPPPSCFHYGPNPNSCE